MSRFLRCLSAWFCAVCFVHGVASFCRAGDLGTLTPQPNGGTLAEIYYPPGTAEGELVYGVTYRLWIPEGVKHLRGIIVHQHGCGKGACEGGATAANDLHWQALAAKWDCGLLGPSFQQEDSQNCRLWCDPRNGSEARFLQALADLAALTGRAEVSQVPWCLWGHSGGGFWSSIMQMRHPERIVAIWYRSGTAFSVWQKGEIPKPEIPTAAYGVPVMMNPGQKENGDERFQSAWTGATEMFEHLRAEGAPVGFAGDPRTGHECGDCRYLAIRYFDACLELRLPPAVKPLDPLRPVDVSAGMLAPLLSGEAMPFAEYSGEKASAVWLPNQDFAQAYRQYLEQGYVEDDTPPPAPQTVTVKALPDGSQELTWQAAADLESGQMQFIVLCNGKKIARLPETPSNPYGKPLFQGMSYHDTPQAPLPAMRYVDPSPGDGEKIYQVISVNSMGMESAPSDAAVTRQ